MCQSMMQGSNENIKEIIGIISILDYLILSSNMCYTTVLYSFQDRKDVILMKIKNEIEVKKKRVGYTVDTKESKTYGCVCTCCHADELPWS